jgi:hypothetical protein
MTTASADMRYPRRAVAGPVAEAISGCDYTTEAQWGVLGFCDVGRENPGNQQQISREEQLRVDMDASNDRDHHPVRSPTCIKNFRRRTLDRDGTAGHLRANQIPRSCH